METGKKERKRKIEQRRDVNVSRLTKKVRSTKLRSEGNVKRRNNTKTGKKEREEWF